MQDEQMQRFEAMLDLVNHAKSTVDDLERLALKALHRVDESSSYQAEQLQRIQESAGSAVRALMELTDLARHARSFQAQADNEAHDDEPH
jgi:hypothetical protein